MMKKSIGIFLSLVMMGQLLHATAYVGDFHGFGLGARGLALGKSQVASTSDSYSFYWNPAGLGKMQDYTLTSMTYQTFGFVDNNFVGATVPIGLQTTISGGYFQTSLDGIIETTINGVQTGDTFGYGGEAGYLAVGHQFDTNDPLMSGWSIGVTAKQLQQSLKDQSGSATALDLGFQYDLQPGIRLGAVFHNIYQSGFSWDTGTSEDLPLITKLGAVFENEAVSLSGEYVGYADRDADWLTGFEWRTMRSEEFSFAWRAGLRPDVFSLGLGITLLGFDIDYVFLIQESAVLDNQHLFSISLALGSIEKEVLLEQEDYYFDTQYLDLDAADEFGFEWVDYLDMDNHPLKDTAERLKRIDLLPNVAYLKPKIPITREYLAVQLVSFFGLSPTDLSALVTFPDVLNTMDNYLEMATVVELGYMDSRFGGYFDPDEHVTRAEAVASIVTVLEDAGVQLADLREVPFQDMPSDSRLNLAIQQAYSMGLIKAAASFYPNKKITVAELISIISRTPPIQEQLSVYLKQY